MGKLSGTVPYSAYKYRQQLQSWVLNWSKSYKATGVKHNFTVPDEVSVTDYNIEKNTDTNGWIILYMSVQVGREISAVQAQKRSPSSILQHMGKNILEDSKGSLSERKTLLPCVEHSSSNRGAFRRLSKDIVFLSRKVCNSSEIFLAFPFRQADKHSFSRSWPCLPNVPEQRGTEQCLSPVVYTLTEQRRENCT